MSQGFQLRRLPNISKNLLDVAIANTTGRFFGLYVDGGRVFNAQLRNMSPNYVSFYDRNRKTTETISRHKIIGVTFCGRTLIELGK